MAGSGTANQGGVSATSLNLPFSLIFDPATYSLYVTELSSRRVKRYTLPCPAILAPTSQSFAEQGGTGSLTITLPGSCPWTAVNNTPSLITLTSASSGTGNGMLSFSVGTNSNLVALSGTISINGQTFTVAQGAHFNDVPTTDPFHDFIGKLSARGITNGCGSGNFCSNQMIPRDQAAIFLIRALGETPSTTQRFSDVPMGSFGFGEINRLFELGISGGCGGGNYCPTSLLTRGQFAVFLVRAFNL